jgi:ABC-type glycerol-3-phosphate transport system substrate-binding protein
VIPTGSPHAQEAFDYLAYLSTQGVVEWYKRIPDVPTNAQVQAVPPDVVTEKRGAEFAADITAFLQEQAGVATAMWDSPVQPFGQDQLARAIEKIYTKAATPAEALAEAQGASQAELERVLGG